MERIDKYLKGSLIGEELETFLSQLESDHDFAKEVAFRKELYLGVHESVLRDKKQLLENFDAKLINTSTDRKSEAKIVKFPLRKLLGMAAAVALCIAAVTFLLPDRASSFDKKHAQLFEPFPSEISITRSGKQTTNDGLIMKAHGFYQTEQYLKAAPLFEQIYVRDQDTMALFYAGISYLGAKELSKAKQILQKPIDWNVNKEYLQKINRILE